MKATPTKPLADRLAAVLDLECSDEQIGRVLRECLTATVCNRAGIVEPDYKTRLATAQFVTAQRHGLPVRREEVVSVSVEADSAIGMEERLRGSPALRAMFQAMLDRVGGAIDV